MRLIRVTRDTWDGQSTICLDCYVSIGRFPGYLIDDAPLAQSMSRLGFCDECLPGIVDTLTYAAKVKE